MNIDKKKTVKMIIIMVLFVLLFVWGRRELLIDSCLDAGGRWLYEKGECQMSENVEVPLSDVP